MGGSSFDELPLSCFPAQISKQGTQLDSREFSRQQKRLNPR
jgi:hypothetical protein